MTLEERLAKILYEAYQEAMDWGIPQPREFEASDAASKHFAHKYARAVIHRLWAEDVPLKEPQ